MLAGVGGWTVEEAKERMSFAESQQWAAYIEKHGPLHIGMRLEFGFALIATVINHAMGGKASIEDYMPHMQKQAGTIEDVMKILTGSRNV